MLKGAAIAEYLPFLFYCSDLQKIFKATLKFLILNS